MSKRPIRTCLLISVLLSACGSTPESKTSQQTPPSSELIEPQAESEVLPVREQVEASEAPEALGALAEPAEDIPAWEVRGVRTAYSRAGTYLIKWLPVGGELPKNKHFELDLWLFKVGEELEPFSGALVATRGWMPEHGHGMLRQPRSVNLEHGHYRISGMLLHMGGYWQIFFDIVVDGQAESTQFDLTL